MRNGIFQLKFLICIESTSWNIMQYAKCLFWWETKKLFSGQTSSGAKRIYQLKILNIPRKQWLKHNKSYESWNLFGGKLLFSGHTCWGPDPLVIIPWVTHCDRTTVTVTYDPLRSGISLVTWGVESPWWPYLVHFVLRVDSLGQGLSVLGPKSLDPHRWILVITRPGHHVGKEQARQCC